MTKREIAAHGPSLVQQFGLDAECELRIRALCEQQFIIWQKLERENAYLLEEATRALGEIIGQSRPMRQVSDQIAVANVLAALNKSRWKVYGRGGAAELLGIKPGALLARMKKLGLNRPPFHGIN